MDLEATATDLNDKIPCLRHILRPEYASYLTTIATVLIGWLLVTWIFHIIWMLLTPLAIGAIVIAIIYPTTTRWYFQQLGTNLKVIVNDFIYKCLAHR
ncbi:uncharacterized protein LOC109503746 isoform X2 [Harpegnathos saltator]|uniref:uncharacterized protein LOC109503746 isoform X2 n=1 Tax=Harpegnathos saltator TaxID=610380 RepID=UPI000948CB71|nr:uncharacterized protein LOC109503746 isoform X2 [Harpegnathos saltator]